MLLFSNWFNWWNGVVIMLRYITVISLYHSLSRVISMSPYFGYCHNYEARSTPEWNHPRWITDVQAVPEVDEDCLNDDGPWHSTKPVWRWRGEGMDGWWSFTVQVVKPGILWFNGNMAKVSETKFKLLTRSIHDILDKNNLPPPWLYSDNFLLLCSE